MTDSALDQPSDLEIRGMHRGDISCRKLIIHKDATVVGTINAVDVRNHGRIRGVVNASKIFINDKDAKVWGNVFAPLFGKHPESFHEGLSSHTEPFESDTYGFVTPRAIDNAVQEGIRRGLAKIPLEAVAPVPENATHAASNLSAAVDPAKEAEETRIVEPTITHESIELAEATAGESADEPVVTLNVSDLIVSGAPVPRVETSVHVRSAAAGVKRRVLPPLFNITR